VDRNTRIVRQFEEVFEPHSTMFTEMKGRKEAGTVQNNTKNTKTFLLGREVNISLDFLGGLGV